MKDQRDALNADKTLSERPRKDLEAKLGTRSDEGLIKMMHGLLAADRSFDSMLKEGIKEETLFGVVQRECMDSQVSTKGIEHDIWEIKRRLYDRRRCQVLGHRRAEGAVRHHCNSGDAGG